MLRRLTTAYSVRSREPERVLDQVRPTALRTGRRGRHELIADAPGEVAVDARRAVVETVGAVGQPLVGELAAARFGEREERDQMTAGRNLPHVRRAVVAAAEQETPIHGKRDGLGLLQVSREPAERRPRAHIPVHDRLAPLGQDGAVGREGDGPAADLGLAELAPQLAYRLACG